MSSRNLLIVTNATDPYLIYQQISDSGSAGLIWNKTTLAWESNPASNDRKITVSAVSGITGAAVAGSGTLGTYTGKMAKWSMDGTTAIAGELVDLVSGVEVRQSVSTDITGLPALVRTELNSNPVPSSNMRGTDSALLAASYTAPNNTGITNAALDAAFAKASAQTVEARLTAARAGYLDNLNVGGVVLAASGYTAPNNAGITTAAADATSAKVAAEAVSTRVTTTRAGYLDNLSGGPILTAAGYTAPNNAGITTAAADATAAKVAAEAVSTRVTTTRAGYLDNLSGGAVATATQVTALQNAIGSELSGPADVQKPSSGSTAAPITLFIYSSTGTLVDPDGNTATITVANSAGTDRSANLTSGTMTRVAAGQYRADYNVSSAHANELLVFTATYVKGGNTVKELLTMSVTSVIADSFTTGDRTKLDALHAKLPSRAFFAATDASTGDINVANMTGDKTTFGATSTITTAITAAQTAIIAQGNTAWVTATGFLTSADARLNNLNATISSRSTFTPSGAIALQSDITALQSHGNTNWATATGFLTSADARLNNLNATISSRSTFDPAVTRVKIDPTEDIAKQATLSAVKAKTDLIPAAPAAVGNIPTAGEITTSVAATLTTEHGSGTWTTGTATLAKQDAILAALSGIGGGSPVASVIVANNRTWRLNGDIESSISPQIITVRKNDAVTIAMDFSEWMNLGTALATVASVTESSGAFSATSLVVDQSRRRAHFNLTVPTAGLYRVLVAVTTSDGQTLNGSGTLMVID